MNLPNVFLNWQSLAIALVLYAATEGVRRFVQSLWKGWRTNAFYTEFVLWTLPSALGAVFGGAVGSFPWPVELTTSSSRAVYGAVLGIFCGVVYNRAKHVVSTMGKGEPSSKA